MLSRVNVNIYNEVVLAKEENLEFGILQFFILYRHLFTAESQYPRNISFKIIRYEAGSNLQIHIIV